MGKRRRYSAAFKFNLVCEALASEKTEAELARLHNVHPVTLSNWKKRFLEQGSKVFSGDDALREKEKEIARLERLLGRKEVELALVRNFFSDQ